MSKNGRAQIRKTAGLTQMKLAGLAGISQARISSWENGDAELTPQDIVEIAKVIREHLGRTPQFSAVGDLVRALSTGDPANSRQRFTVRARCSGSAKAGLKV
jgi:transcriptional regulator with XRE-family HTH domain